MDVKLESNTSPPDAAPAQSLQEVGPVPALPEDALIIVPVRNLILFPGMILPLNIGREQSIAAAQQAVRAERPIGLLLQKDPSVERPDPDDEIIVTHADPARSIRAAVRAHPGRVQLTDLRRPVR